MSATTLVTFLFEAPSSAITVELVGSWDRFTKSYPLSRDSRTGPGHWRGCHTFTDITCDGDSNDMSASRDGGLKMGGKYWYFYRLDGDVEYHNPVEPSTDLCPFLPGQRVNILEVPVQAVESRTRSGSFGCDVYTLDPKAKYVKPQPSVHRTLVMSSFNKRCDTAAAALPDEACSSTAKLPQRETSSTTSYPKSASPRKAQSSGSTTKRLLSAVFSKMRLTRSAGVAGGSEYANGQYDYPPHPRTSNEMHGQITKPTSLAKDCGPDFSRLKLIPNALQTVSKPVHGVKSALSALDDESCSRGREDAIRAVLAREGSNPIFAHCKEQPLKRNSLVENFATHGRDRSTLNVTLEPASEMNFRHGPHRTEGANEEQSDLHHDEIYGGTQSYAGSLSSYTTNNLFSPGLSSSFVHTDGMSPYHLSQPDSPLLSEFGDFLGTGLLSKPERHVTSSTVQGAECARDNLTPGLREKGYANFRGFPGYSTSETEQATALTMRKIPSLGNLESRGSSTPFSNQGSKDLIHSWNDGSEHRMTALEELVDDLGYLGELII